MKLQDLPPFYHIQKYDPMRNISRFCLLSLQGQREALKQCLAIKQLVCAVSPVSHHDPTTILCITIATITEQVPVYEQDWKALLLLLLWPNPGKAVFTSRVGSKYALKTCLMLQKTETKRNGQKSGMFWISREFIFMF